MGLCREKIRKLKAQLELNLATAIEDSKEWGCKCISNNSRTKENFPSLWDVAGGWSLFPDIKG